MNISKSQLSTKYLDSISKALPRGSQKRIADMLGIFPSEVSNVLKGATENDQVIEAALKILKERKEAIQAMEERIREVL